MAKTTTKTKTTIQDDEVKLSKPEEIEETGDSKESDDAKNESFDILRVKDPNIKDYVGAIFVRQYSRSVHGDDFEALADEFCTKDPKAKGMVYVKIPTENIGKVEVRYREKADYEKHPDQQDPNAPMEDKVRVFDNKAEAVRFGTQKIQSTVVVSRSKGKK